MNSFKLLENKNGVKISQHKETITFKRSGINTLGSFRQLEKKSNVKKDRENFYHLGGNIRTHGQFCPRHVRKPEGLVGQKNALSGRGTLSHRYDQQLHRTVFALSRHNKRSREEIAKIDADFFQ